MTLRELELDLKDARKICYARSLHVEEKDFFVSYCLFANLQYEVIGETKMEENSDAEIKILVEEDESTTSN